MEEYVVKKNVFILNRTPRTGFIKKNYLQIKATRQEIESGIDIFIQVKSHR